MLTQQTLALRDDLSQLDYIKESSEKDVSDRERKRLQVALLLGCGGTGWRWLESRRVEEGRR